MRTEHVIFMALEMHVVGLITREVRCNDTHKIPKTQTRLLDVDRQQQKFQKNTCYVVESKRRRMSVTFVFAHHSRLSIYRSMQKLK